MFHFPELCLLNGKCSLKKKMQIEYLFINRMLRHWDALYPLSILLKTLRYQRYEFRAECLSLNIYKPFWTSTRACATMKTFCILYRFSSTFNFKFNLKTWNLGVILTCNLSLKNHFQLLYNNPSKTLSMLFPGWQ